jgi:hypothetical protein
MCSQATIQVTYPCAKLGDDMTVPLSNSILTLLWICFWKKGVVYCKILVFCVSEQLLKIGFHLMLHFSSDICHWCESRNLKKKHCGGTSLYMFSTIVVILRGSLEFNMIWFLHFDSGLGTRWMKKMDHKRYELKRSVIVSTWSFLVYATWWNGIIGNLLKIVLRKFVSRDLKWIAFELERYCSSDAISLRSWHHPMFVLKHAKLSIDFVNWVFENI